MRLTRSVDAPASLTHSYQESHTFLSCRCVYKQKTRPQINSKGGL